MKIFYRPEIDGLRGIAVISVLIYHLDIFIGDNKLLKGGFLGVDIFFVISGYLITSIIFKELLNKGTFSFKHFYERRIRRILPALILVMLFSFLLAYFYLPPEKMLHFTNSIFFSLIFTSNLYFWITATEYGALSAIEVPFLHTWSLSVEEQFYLFFPVFFFILFKYFRKYLFFILITVFFLSLIIAEYGSKNYPLFNFYILPTRVWELLLGSFIAYSEYLKRNSEILQSTSKNGWRAYCNYLNLLLLHFGLFLLLFAIIFFDKELGHPSIKTLVPTLGTFLIIKFKNKNSIVIKILSSNVLVGIGLISYSLYLFHYPIIVFYNFSEFYDQNIINKIFLFIVIVFISVVSYFFIERPARDKKIKFKSILICLLTLILILFFIIFLSFKTKGVINRTFPSIISNILSEFEYRKISQNSIPCHNRTGENGFCIFNESKDNIGDIVLLGDSLTDAILASLIEKISHTKYRLIHMGYSGNLFLPDFVRYSKNQKKIDLDEKVHKYRKDFLINNTNKNTYIVVFGDYNYYFERRLKFSKNKKIIKYETDSMYVQKNNENKNYDERMFLLKNKFRDTLLEYSKEKKIILVYPIPTSPINIKDYVFLNFRKKIKNNFLDDKINYSKDIYQKFNSEVINLFNQINSKNIFKVELENSFCPKTQCILYDDDNIYLFDTVHPSYKGSIIINDLILKDNKNREKG